LPKLGQLKLQAGAAFGEIRVRHRRLWEKLVRLGR